MELLIPPLSGEADDMKQKKNCSEICLTPLNYYFTTENASIQNIIVKLSRPQEFTVQQECIKSFADYLGSTEADEESKQLVLRMLAFLFISTDLKHAIKKTIARTLSVYKDTDLLTMQFSESIKLLLMDNCNVKNPTTAVKIKDYFITCLGSSLDCLPVVTAVGENIDLVFNFTFTFLSEAVDYLWNRTLPPAYSMTQLRTFIYNATKFLLALLQKCKVRVVCEENVLKLITTCYDIMTHKHVVYDVKSNCGYIMVLLFAGLPEEIIQDCFVQQYPYLEFLKFGKQPSAALEKLGIKPIEDKTLFETFKVCVYVGILIVATHDVLWQHKICDEYILSFMFKELTDLSKCVKGNFTQIVGIAKAISIMSSHLNDLPLDDLVPIFRAGLIYVIIYLDDRLEIVKNYTKIVFENLIKLAVKNSDQGSDELMKIIMQWLINLPDCSTRYSGLTILCSQIGCAYLLKDIPDLPKQLLNEIVHLSRAYNICCCFESLMLAHLKEVDSEEYWVEQWVNAIIEALKKSQPPLTEFFQRLFISAFKMQPIALKALTQQRFLNTDNELGAFLGCLNIARKTGLTIPTDSFYKYQINQDNSWRNLLDKKTLNVLMTFQSDEVRVQALALILGSQRTTELFTAWELKFLSLFIYYNMNTSNPKTRQQIIALAKKCMNRVNDSRAVLKRTIESSQSKPNVEEGSQPNSNLEDNFQPKSTLDDQEKLLDEAYANFWVEIYQKILLPGLNLDCNYSRRSTCLELLQFASEDDPLPFTDMCDIGDLNNLKYILQFDTYERNKKLAAQLLSKFNSKRLGFQSEECVFQHINHCFSLAISIKPSQTISAGYMLQAVLCSPHTLAAILKKIAESVKPEKVLQLATLTDTEYLLVFQLMLELRFCHSIGKQNLQEAAASRPIHGFVFCLRHLLNAETLRKKATAPGWKNIIKLLVDLCLHLIELVKTIICNESPEGYLPEDSDSDNLDTDETAKAQMVTVYGWRAAKEISLLLGEIALNAAYFDSANPNGLINEQQLRRIGDCLVDLLINTKHRGAFEQAAIGFTNLATRLWRLPTAINKLPGEWLQKIINTVLEVGEESVEACATRRSAGVPFMVQAVLITEPNTSGNEKFNQCMTILLKGGGDVSKVADHRIHCLNILRTLYRNNQLNELVIPYCAQGLMISIQGFQSKIWGIRNSATLLFSALMIRIFGVPRTRDVDIVNIKNKMLAQVFFTRYPELYKFLLNELEKAKQDDNSPSLFPVLLILSRLYCSADRSDVSQLDEYLRHVKACASHPMYRIRDLAAKTCTSLLQPTEIANYIVFCFVQLSNVKLLDTNCHGILLQVHYLLKAKQRMSYLNVAKFIDGTAWILICCSQQISHLTATLYLEVLLNLIRWFDPYFSQCEIFKNLFALLQWGTKQERQVEQMSTCKGKHIVYMFSLKLCAIIHMMKCRQCHGNFDNISSYEDLILDDLKSHLELRNVSLEYVQYLKFSDRKFESHNLNADGDSQYHELIIKVIKPLNYVYKKFLYEVLKGALGKIDSQSVARLADPDLLDIYILQQTRSLIENNQSLLHFYIMFCNRTNEKTVCASIAYLDNFLSTLTEEDILQLNFNKTIDTVLKHSLPSSDFLYRLGMCKLLVHNKRLFYRTKSWILSWSNLCMIWEAVFILLQDDEEHIRNTICQLCQEDLTTGEYDYAFVPATKIDIPEFARKPLLDAMITTMPIHCSIDILLSWILRGKDVIRGNLSEVFDEGELNTHAEVYTMARAATQALRKILWTLDDGINFKDKSIFIEEQSLLIATTLYDKFFRKIVPLIRDKMQTAVRISLARAVLFLEKVVVNQPDFRQRFSKVIIESLQAPVVKVLDVSERRRLKMFLENIFGLVEDGSQDLDETEETQT